MAIFNGKIHYKWPFSIAMLVHQRVYLIRGGWRAMHPSQWCCNTYVTKSSSRTPNKGQVEQETRYIKAPLPFLFGVPTIILAWLLLYILQKNGRTYFPTNKTHFIIRFLGMILKVRIYTCYISVLYTYMIIYVYYISYPSLEGAFRHRPPWAPASEWVKAW